MENYLALTLFITLSCPSYQNTVCWLEAQLLSPHLVHLYASNTSLQNNCGLTNEEHAIGMLAECNASLGLGVISATVGNGWVVTLLETVQNDHESNSSVLEWSFQSEICWFELQEELGFSQFPPVLDVGEHLHLQVMSAPVNSSSWPSSSTYLLPRHFGDMVVLIENASLFDFSTSVSRLRLVQTLTLDLWQKPLGHPSPTQITFQLHMCPLTCHSCSVSVSITSDCLEGKGLVLSYPVSLNESSTHNIPPNYRPPSSLGAAISTSPHVYNADPSLPLPDCSLNLSHPPVFKQCEGQSSRADCACTLEEMTTVDDISWSDCIQEAHRHFYAEVFPLVFTMGDNETVPLATVVMEELNNRSDYRVESAGIKFEGAGLFHFRAELPDSESFCPTSTQFIVFVVRDPLTRAEEQIISSLTAVSCGVALLLAYLIHSYISARARPSQIKTKNQ